MQGAIAHYTEHPDHALSQDKEAVAVIEEGLRARAVGPDGQTLVCDMPAGIGGGARLTTWRSKASLKPGGNAVITSSPAKLSIRPCWRRVATWNAAATT